MVIPSSQCKAESHSNQERECGLHSVLRDAYLEEAFQREVLRSPIRNRRRSKEKEDRRSKAQECVKVVNIL